MKNPFEQDKIEVGQHVFVDNHYGKILKMETIDGKMQYTIRFTHKKTTSRNVSNMSTTIVKSPVRSFIKLTFDEPALM